MSNRNNGGPAFPVDDLQIAGIGPSSLNVGGAPAWAGMSLRDWFAGLALQGMLANTDAEDERAHRTGSLAPVVAENAYQFADAMIAERNRTP